MLFCEIFSIILIALKIQVSANNINDAIVFPDDNDEPRNQRSNQIQSFKKVLSFLASDIENVQKDLENGEFFHNDIVTEQQTNGILSSRTGLLEEEYRWPKNIVGHVNVPYTVSKESKYSKIAKKFLMVVCIITCLRFQLLSRKHHCDMPWMIFKKNRAFDLSQDQIKMTSSLFMMEAVVTQK